MPAILFYLLKLSVSLSVVFIFYHMVLRKLTFYNWNRLYLLAYTLLSFIIPFINISPVLEKNNLATNDIVSWVPSVNIQNSGILVSEEIAQKSFSGWHIATIIITGGIILLLIRLLVQLFSFRRMKRKAKPVIVSGVNIYQVDENIIPFSFGNSIFINRYLHTETELPEIIRHEFIHVKQKHSLDIIWSEILCMLNWYNPFAWLLKKSIRQNLEFIADNKVLENGINRKEYQYLLLKVIGNNQYSIATQFNFSSLKKRIAMMNKTKSAKRQLIRLFFLLPATAILLLAFRDKLNTDKLKRSFYSDNINYLTTDTVPDAPSAKGKWTEIRDMDVKSFTVNNNQVTVILKNGKKENYDLNDAEQKKSFEKKYGKIPPPPPPPPSYPNESPVEPPVYNIPAPPPPPPYSVESLEPPPAYNVPAPPPPPVVPKLPDYVKGFYLNNNKVIITLKNGDKEHFDLNKPEQKEKFEKKYGKLPEPPPPPAGIRNAPLEVSGVAISPLSAPLTAMDIATSPSPASAKVRRGVIAPATDVVEIARIASPPIPATSVTGPEVATVSGNVIITNATRDDIIGEESIVITITKNTTRQQLDEFVKQMKTKGMELRYDEIEYDNKGKLIKIACTMKSKNGQNNAVATEFDKLTILSLVHSDGRNYFKVTTE